MNQSFYTAAVSAGAHQARLDVVSNNLANVNTNGYKAVTPAFVDLLYRNISAEDGTPTNLENGVGTRMERTDTVFKQGAFKTTDMPLDFAIDGDGFFAVYDPTDNQTKYTRAGSFALSAIQAADPNTGEIRSVFRLVDGEGNFLLDANENPIEINSEEEVQFSSARDLNIGVFDFNIKEGMLRLGTNYYLPQAKNGNPVLVNRPIEKGVLEASTADSAQAFVQMIEGQRAFQMALRMVRTSDEVANTINTLRN